MGGIRILASSQLRRRWRSLLFLGVLTGLVGTAVLGALTAARRTTTAYDRLARAAALDDVRVQVLGTDHGARVAALPSVAKAWAADMVIARPEGPDVVFMSMTAGPARPDDLYRPIIVEGRAASPTDPTEVVISEAFHGLSGIQVGTRTSVTLITREEFTQFDVGFGEPDGPTLPIEVVGIARVPGNTSTDIIVGTPALAAALPDDVVIAQVMFLRLKPGTTVSGFRAELDAIAGELGFDGAPGGQAPYEVFEPAEDRAAVTTTANTLAAGLVVFALVALLAGVFVLAQAFARHHAIDGPDRLIESSLGMTRRQSIVARALPAVVTAVFGSLIAVAGAIASSAWTPAGSVARFEPSPGITIAVGWLLPGTVALIALVIAIDAATAIVAVRRSRSQDRPRHSPVADLVSSVGGRESLVIGLRQAFEAGGGRAGVPVRSALIAVTLGISGFAGVIVFQSSVDRLTATPSRYGWNADLLVADVTPETSNALSTDTRIGAFTEAEATTVRLGDGTTVAAYAFTHRRGRIDWTMLEGRMPATEDEITLGSRVAGRLGLSIPDRITIGDDPAVSLTVVGIGIGPSPQQSLFGETIAVTPETLSRVSPHGTYTEGHITVAAGISANELYEDLATRYEMSRIEAPAEVLNLDQLGVLPSLLGIFFGLLAVGATANVLFVGVRRRRKDFAVLRTLGFTAPQVRAAIRTTGMTTMTVGLLFGLPVGIAAGRSVWKLVAERTFVATDASLPAAWLVPVIPVALATGLLLAVVPSVRAARIQPGVALRTE